MFPLRVSTFLGGRFRPKDDTPEELERAKLKAIEAKRALEEKHQVLVDREV